MKYTLELPKEHELKSGIDNGKKVYFVGVEKDYKLYLRPSNEVLVSTGYSEGRKIGYWNTYEEALQAKEKYELSSN